MKYLKSLALLLVIVGGANWLLVALAKFDLVAAITGASFGEVNIVSGVIYALVGIAAVALIPTLLSWVTGSEQAA